MDLFPQPSPKQTFLASWRLGWPSAHSPCTNGSATSSCMVLVGAETLLHAETGSAPQSQCVAKPNITVAYRLLQLAPVLPSGWVLAGELQKISPLSPQRFQTRSGGMQRLTSGTASDALLPSELSSNGADLEFRLVGGPHEIVEVTVVSPGPGSTASAQAMAGTVLVLQVKLDAAGAATVRCFDGQCDHPTHQRGARGEEEARLARGGSEGCSDGSCEGFCNTSGVAACATNWTGVLNLRAPRSSAGHCGGEKPCVAAADACATGWKICLSTGETASGHSSAAALTAQVSAAQCAVVNGSFATAMGSARRFPCPLAPPGCDMGCMADGYGAEPVCCGTDCHVPSCSNGVWPAPGTLIKMGSGTPHRTCASALGGWFTGVLCCKDD